MFIEWVNESTKSIFSNIFEWYPDSVRKHIYTQDAQKFCERFLPVLYPDSFPIIFF